MAVDIFAELCAKIDANTVEFEKKMGAVDKKTKKTTASMRTSFNKVATLLGGALVGKFFIDSVKATARQEDALHQLNNVLRSTNHVAGLTSEELQEMAKSLSEVTTFSDEALNEAQGLMLTFTKIGKDVFPRALEAGADMSVMFGQDMKQSMIQLGTALNDPIMGVGRLRRIGISFTEQQKEQIRVLTEAGDIMGAQTVILDELNAEFGKAARAAGETFSGKLKQLSNTFVDLKEKIGKGITENKAFNDAIKDLKAILADPQLAESLKSIAGFIGEMAALAAKGVVKILKLAGALIELREQNKAIAESQKKFADQTEVAQKKYNLLIRILGKGSEEATKVGLAYEEINQSAKRGTDRVQKLNQLFLMISKGKLGDEIKEKFDRANKSITKAFGEENQKNIKTVTKETVKFGKAVEQLTPKQLEEINKAFTDLTETMPKLNEENEDLVQKNRFIQDTTRFAGENARLLSNEMSRLQITTEDATEKIDEAAKAAKKEKEEFEALIKALANANMAFGVFLDTLSKFGFISNDAAKMLGDLAGGISSVVEGIATGGFGGITTAVGAAIGIVGSLVDAFKSVPPVAEQVADQVKNISGSLDEYVEAAIAAAKETENMDGLLGDLLNSLNEQVVSALEVEDAIRDLQNIYENFDKIIEEGADAYRALKDAMDTADIEAEIKKINEEMKDMKVGSDQWLKAKDKLKEYQDQLDDAIDVQNVFGGISVDMFDSILAFQDKVAKNKKLVDSIDNWGKAMSKLNEIGGLNINTYSLMEDQLKEMANRADEAFNKLIDQGFTADEAFKIMGDDLKIIKDLQDKYGLEVDDATQALIDMADEAGIFDEMQDPTEILADLLREIVKLLGGTVGTLNDVKTAAGGAFDAMTKGADDAKKSIEGLAPIIKDISGGFKPGTFGDDLNPIHRGTGIGGMNSASPPVGGFGGGNMTTNNTKSNFQVVINEYSGTLNARKLSQDIGNNRYTVQRSIENAAKRFSKEVVSRG